MPEPVSVSLGDRVSVRFYRREYPGEIVEVTDRYAKALFALKRGDRLVRKVTVFRAGEALPANAKPGHFVATYVGPAAPVNPPPVLPDGVP
jgi:hypothetical protein